MIIENCFKKNHNHFSSKSRNGGEFTKLVFYNNHEIAGITNYETTKCGDLSPVLEMVYLLVLDTYKFQWVNVSLSFSPSIINNEKYTYH